jgi:hypothetical protein
MVIELLFDRMNKCARGHRQIASMASIIAANCGLPETLQAPRGERHRSSDWKSMAALVLRELIKLDFAN